MVFMTSVTGKYIIKMKIEKEIERIKSLFTEERLYGNLVNEDCSDCADCTKSDMADYLDDNGYYVKKVDTNTTIDDEGCKNGDFYNKVWDNMKTVADSEGLGTVEIFKDSRYGCSISVGFKSKATTDPYYVNLQLWEDKDFVLTKTYYSPKDGTNTSGNPIKMLKFLIEGKWEWQSDHIEFKGKVTKMKLVEKNPTTGDVDKTKSNKYQKSKPIIGAVNATYNKFEELVKKYNK